MAKEVFDILITDPSGSYVDCTAGQGEHLTLMLAKLNADASVTALDCDPLAIDTLTKKFADEKRVKVVRGNFSSVKELAGEGQDGIFMDLGFSSTQVDGEGSVQISFKRSEELDMRLDPSTTLTAAGIVNDWPEKEIARVLKENADERHARRIAARIVRERQAQPFETTLQLRNTVSAALAGVTGKWKKDPATRTFLALRIEVNAEMENLRRGLEEGLAALKSGGRLVVLTYHSGEDRLVKRMFRGWAAHQEMLDERRGITREVTPVAKDLTRKGLKPSEREVNENPRARSAVLRAIEKAA